MASGDTLFVLTPLNGVPPTPGGNNLNPATLDIITDGSAPTINIPVLDFDGALDEHYEWYVVCPSNYADGGLTFKYHYAMSSTDGNIVEMEFRVIVLTDALLLTGDLGMDTATAAALQDDPNDGANILNYSGTVGLSHANAGTPDPGDPMVIRATRDESAVQNVDDLQLLAIYVTET